MASLLIDLESKTPVYKQIIEQIRHAVLSGDINGGDSLPSIRQLAADLEINHNTIAKSYRALEQDEIIQTARSKGTFVSKDAIEKLTVNNEKHFKTKIQVLFSEMKNAHLSNLQITKMINDELKKIKSNEKTND